jgi:hypothetical protein
MNPEFTKNSSGDAVNATTQRYKRVTVENTLQLADLKYYNYALPDTKILELLSNGFGKKAAKKNIKDKAVNFHQVSSAEMQLQEVKEI